LDATLDITLLNEPSKTLTVKDKDFRSGDVTSQKLPLYTGSEKVTGRIDIHSAKKSDHMGIRVELIGLIEVKNEVSSTSTFMSNGLDLEAPGSLTGSKSFDFAFNVFQKPYESFYGNTVKLRYLIRGTILASKYKSPIIRERDLGVMTDSSGDIEASSPIRLEVGIDDFLNIKVNFPRNVFHLRDTIEGFISFLTINLVIKTMELAIVRKEILGTGQKASIATDELIGFEIMDGSPIKGSLKRR
jgi:vacuolar protein sorting-associated protein 26